MLRALVLLQSPLTQRLTTQGVMYILHGPRVDATTDGSGNFHELTSAQIDALDAGSWFGADYAGERVPRLEEFLR